MNTSYPTLNFGLGEDIEMLRDQVYQFAQNEIAPLAEQADADNQFPNQLWTKLGDMGLLGVTVALIWATLRILSQWKKLAVHQVVSV